MSGRIKRKWRPSLALVIGGTLAAVFSLPVLGVTWLRLGGNIFGWAETGWLIAWIAVVVTAVLAYLLWRLVLQPVWSLSRYAAQMKSATGQVAAPDKFGTAELSDLGQNVIEMAAALQARARSLSAYADHVTHELRSPLTSLRGAADLLEAGALSQDDQRALLNTMQTSLARMEHLLSDMRSHAATRLEATPGSCTLSEALAGADIPEGLQIAAEGDPALSMSAADLGKVLTQLARNAAEHGATRLALQPTEGGLQIEDNGPGIPEGDRARIFDPFFTTRRDGGGTGMGLAIAQTLIEAAGGTIELAPSASGTRFLIQI